MNKKIVKLLMLTAYCIPYGYLAMNGPGIPNPSLLEEKFILSVVD